MNRDYTKLQLKESPEKKANFLSKFTFWWLRNIYKLGTKGNIKPEDIYKQPNELGSKINTDKFIKLWTDELERENPNLLRILFKTFGTSLTLWAVCYSVVDIAMRITHSLCLGGLVNFFSQNDPEITTEVGIMYATGLLLSLSIEAAVYHPYMAYVTQIAARIKIGLTGLIYRKALRMPLSSTYQSLNGRVINIMADDVSQFDLTLSYLHNAWKGPIEILLFGYVIYREIGYSGIVGIVFLLCFTPLLAYLASQSTKLQNDLSKRTDVRVRIMSEIIAGIRLIKMYGLEKVFENVITKIRRKEIHKIYTLSRYRAMLVSLSLLTRYSIFVSLLTYLYLGNTATPRNIFIIFAFFNLLNWSMLWQWPFSLIQYGQGYVAVKRIQTFLLINETNSDALKGDESSAKRTVNPKHETKGIILTNVTSKWQVCSNRIAGIYDLSLNIPIREHCVIIGPVGSGKSSLLYLISGELQMEKGHCEIYGKISYASQVPWIFEGTVRQNIIFNEKFEEQKYQNVIRVCGLLTDISEMPYEDLTIVGECGFTLSGGQRARINLARAIYQNADIYILDDPLAALDYKIGTYVFQQCIQRYLADRCCLWVTNDILYLNEAQHLVVLRDGHIEIQGTFQEVRDNDMCSFLNVATAACMNSNVSIDENQETTSMLSILTICGDDHYYMKRVEQQFKGSRLEVYKFYFVSVQSLYLVSLLIFLFIAAHSIMSGVDFYISNWNVGAHWEIMTSVPKMKTKQDRDNKPVDHTLYIKTYFALLIAGTVAYIYRTFKFFALCLRASISLHNELFLTIVRAKIDFFDNNPSGRILNRFTKDLIHIDSQLAQPLIEFISFTLEFLAVIITVSIIVNLWMLVPSLIISIFFCLLRYIYTSTSQSIQRIEAISLSPLYSHINNTLQGLSTIRILNVQNVVQEEFYEHLNFNSAVLYVKSSTSHAFSFWVDVICLLYIGICAISFVLYRGNVSSELFGIALLHCINLIGMCQWGTRDTSEIENEMTSVERIIEYTKIPSEPPLNVPNNLLSHDWPSCGEIIFKNVYFKYSSSSQMVLKNLNFKINAGEKIGIIGRTGAGKSSIVEAIFRMEEFDGDIIIDGIPTNTLGLHDLRKKISLIPQNPILFSATLRFNLDPFAEKSDAQLWNALDQVEMKEFVKTLTNGLNYNLVKSGMNLSMGQRQLICLARSILRNNKILISDEATASVDPVTDKFIQKAIKSHFSACTVLTISHQLHNVMDSDRILIIEHGAIIEFDHPYILLASSNGYLRRLLDESDPTILKTLIETAKKNFDSAMFNDV